MTATHAPLAGRREWLAAMQATLGACACCLLVAWLAPSVRPWVPLVLSVLWFRGPIGFLLPVGLEPVLMEYGARHPVVAVVAVTAFASAVAETISLRVMRGMASLEALTRARQSVRDSRIVRLFERRPGAAVAFGALSPVPDWITRSLAAVSGYHPARYVVADTLGRLPKLWIPAAAGGLVPLDPMLTRAFLVAQFVLVGGVVGLRWCRSRRRARRLSIETGSRGGRGWTSLPWRGDSRPTWLLTEPATPPLRVAGARDGRRHFRESTMRTLIALLAAALAASPCDAQRDSAPAHRPRTLLSLNAGAAAGPVASGVDAVALLGVQASRLVPRTPGIDAALSLFRYSDSGGSSGGYILDVGVAYAVPASATVSLVPSVGVTGAAAGGADGGSANGGVYVGAGAAWCGPHVTVRGGLTWRGFGVFNGELANLVGATIGVGLAL